MERRKVPTMNEKINLFNKFETIRKSKGIFYIDYLKNEIVKNLKMFTTNINKIYESDKMTSFKKSDIDIPKFNTFDNNQSTWAVDLAPAFLERFKMKRCDMNVRGICWLMSLIEILLRIKGNRFNLLKYHSPQNIAIYLNNILFAFTEYEQIKKGNPINSDLKDDPLRIKIPGTKKYELFYQLESGGSDVHYSNIIINYIGIELQPFFKRNVFKNKINLYQDRFDQILDYNDFFESIEDSSKPAYYFFMEKIQDVIVMQGDSISLESKFGIHHSFIIDYYGEGYVYKLFAVFRLEPGHVTSMFLSKGGWYINNNGVVTQTGHAFLRIPEDFNKDDDIYPQYLFYSLVKFKRKYISQNKQRLKFTSRENFFDFIQMSKPLYIKELDDRFNIWVNFMKSEKEVQTLDPISIESLKLQSSFINYLKVFNSESIINGPELVQYKGEIIRKNLGSFEDVCKKISHGPFPRCENLNPSVLFAKDPTIVGCQNRKCGKMIYNKSISFKTNNRQFSFCSTKCLYDLISEKRTRGKKVGYMGIFRGQYPLKYPLDYGGGIELGSFVDFESDYISSIKYTATVYKHRLPYQAFNKKLGKKLKRMEITTVMEDIREEKGYDISPLAQKAFAGIDDVDAIFGDEDEFDEFDEFGLETDPFFLQEEEIEKMG